MNRQTDWCESHGCLRISCIQRGLHRASEAEGGAPTPEPLSDVELDVIRMWTNIGDQSDRGKLAARGLLVTVDHLRGRNRKLVEACRLALHDLEALAKAVPPLTYCNGLVSLRSAIKENDDV